MSMNASGRYRDAAGAAEEAAAACATADLAWLESELLAIAAMSHAMAAQLSASQTLERRAREAAERVGNDHVAMVLLAARSRHAVVSGDRAAHREQAEAWAEWSKNHQGGFGALPPYFLAVNALLAGDVEEALRFADESLAAVGEVTMYLGFSESVRTLIHAYRGDAASVLREWERWNEGGLLAAPGQANAAGARGRVADGVESLAIIGRPELAASQYQALLELDADGPLGVRAGWINLKALIGIAAHAAGERDLAVDHFEDAIRFSRDLGFEFGLADAYRFYAQTILGETDVHRARELLGEALSIYERLEMPLHAEHAGRLRTRLA
jgi:tetratricopeptide (TPR) repeat protein